MWNKILILSHFLMLYGLETSKTGYIYMSRDARKQVFKVSDLVRHKLVCVATEDGQLLELSELGRRGNVLSV